MIREIDYDDDAQTYLQLLKNLSVVNNESITDKMFYDRLYMIKSNPFHKIFVYIHNNSIVGSITVLIEPKFIHDLSLVGHIEDVVVDPGVGGQGIGSKLISKAVKFCEDNSCYKVILNCDESKTGFYVKNGFSIKNVGMAKYF